MVVGEPPSSTGAVHPIFIEVALLNDKRTIDVGTPGA